MNIRPALAGKHEPHLLDQIRSVLRQQKHYFSCLVALLFATSDTQCQEQSIWTSILLTILAYPKNCLRITVHSTFPSLQTFPSSLIRFYFSTARKTQYQILHDNIIKYLRFLRTKSEQGGISPEFMKAWYSFAEVKQNWLGFCETGNTGRGLGKAFAQALNTNLVHVFPKLWHRKNYERKPFRKIMPD